ncbi:Beta helix incomplete domain containing protein [Pandoravirus quercus]|uniref:Beta helix incomplete domain containing protein n=2 Tax=Pandoravirus TaxID=2060084 RepID=A0A2U7U964_9VIRU|nr:Beta helix incomplete domain containing protein [Pandoravirus quercus]AVK74988.1 Beta helix incomplete domain containing protein [Pandoravirus quercus]QBZ81176.1 Beta helix superfamily incomplete domain containing protein [Pandoravirus celtis]
MACVVRSHIVAVALLWTLLCLGAVSDAVVISVCPTGCDYPNVAEASLAAAHGDVIAVQGGTYASTPAAVIRARVILRATTPVIITGVGVWLTIASPNVTMEGVFTIADAGIVVSPNATWYQDGSVTISHATNAAGYDSGGQPFGAPSVIFVDGGTWVQRAALTVVARTVGVSLGGDSAVWDQQAAADISVPYNGMAGDSHTGVSLAATRTTWHQRGPLTMFVSVGVGVRAGSTGMAQWNQTGDLMMTVVRQSTGPVDGIALGVGTLGEGTVWLQSGLVQIQVTASGISAIGGAIALDANNNRHRWEQTGALKVTLLPQNGALVRGVRIGQRSTTWIQAGPVSVVGRARANGTVHAIVLGSAVWSSDNVWNQSGLLSVNVEACADSAIVPTVPSAAIRGTSRCGTWRSTGVVDLTASSSLCGGASAYPLWLDSRGCNFTLERATVLHNGTVRCDTAPTAPSPAAIRGLPLGTPVQGVCSDLALLPVVSIEWADSTGGSDAGLVGWQRPAMVRARASGAFVGSLPFTLSGPTSVQANATQFVFSGSDDLLSDPVALHLTNRTGTIGLQGSISLVPADGILLGTQTVAAFEVLPWVRSVDDDTLPYTVDVDTSSSTIAITPKDGNGTAVDGSAMAVRFGALVEIKSDGSVARTLRLDTGIGRWTLAETPTTQGATQEFVLTVEAGVATGQAKVEIIVALFDRQVEGLFDGIIPFVSDPALAKTTLRIADWPWATADSRIELDLVLDPPFVNFTRVDSASTQTTTYTLNGSTPTDGRATVRLSTAALVDGRLTTAAVTSRADVNTSSVVVSLPRFESAFVYDPDMGVLFGSSSGGDGDGDGGGSNGGPGTPRAGKASDSSMGQTATVIAAAASIGVAAVLIAVVIAGVVVLQGYRQERLADTVAREVTFDPEAVSDAAL